jgi:hypothetical protein
VLRLVVASVFFFKGKKEGGYIKMADAVFSRPPGFVFDFG